MPQAKKAFAEILKKTGQKPNGSIFAQKTKNLTIVLAVVNVVVVAIVVVGLEKVGIVGVSTGRLIC